MRFLFQSCGLKLVFFQVIFSIISLFFGLSVALDVSEELWPSLGRVSRMVLLLLRSLFGPLCLSLFLGRGELFFKSCDLKLVFFQVSVLYNFSFFRLERCA